MVATRDRMDGKKAARIMYGGKEMSINQVLHNIQAQLSVPKTRRNNFGNYNYRNAEDIVDAVKSLLPDGYSLLLSDDIVMVGSRVYVKAQARLFHIDGSIEAYGWAREPEVRKGMDESQITGASSSYARKYALNGLFAIDDGVDADSQDNRQQAPKPKELTDEQKLQAATSATDKYLKELENTPPNYIDTLDKKHKATLDAINARYPELAKLVNDKKKLLEEFHRA